MGFSRALMHSYSIICRDRGRTSARPLHDVPRGLFTGTPRAHLPPRLPHATLIPSGKIEQRGGRVLARCMSLGRAGSLLSAAGSIVGAIMEDSPGTPKLAKLAMQGLAAGIDAADPFLLDMAAGFLGHTANHGADRLRSYASEELENRGGVLGGKERLLQLALYCAFVDTPIMHTWQDFLENCVLPHDPTGPLAVAVKVILDQGLMAPMATALMLLTLKVLEGGDPLKAVQHAKNQLLEKLLPDYAVWPVARVVQYAIIPQAAHPVFEGVVSITSAVLQVCLHKYNKQQQQQQPSQLELLLQQQEQEQQQWRLPAQAQAADWPQVPEDHAMPPSNPLGLPNGLLPLALSPFTPLTIKTPPPDIQDSPFSLQPDIHAHSLSLTSSTLAPSFSDVSLPPSNPIHLPKSPRAATTTTTPSPLSPHAPNHTPHPRDVSPARVRSPPQKKPHQQSRLSSHVERPTHNHHHHRSPSHDHHCRSAPTSPFERHYVDPHTQQAPQQTPQQQLPGLVHNARSFVVHHVNRAVSPFANHCHVPLETISSVLSELSEHDAGHTGGLYPQPSLA